MNKKAGPFLTLPEIILKRLFFFFLFTVYRFDFDSLDQELKHYLRPE